MSRLPNSDQLVLELRKLQDYCLSATHPRGRHKARVFREALGLTRDDAGWLRDSLLDAAKGTDAEKLDSDAMGQRWRVDVDRATGPARYGKNVVDRANRRNLPRFVTCWVL